jgi:hypothetical protein
MWNLETQKKVRTKWVGFLKQSALPGKAPQNKKSSKKIQKIKIINKKSQINQK